MKEDLEKLHRYLQAINVHWEQAKYTTLSVLVQNMAHRGEVQEEIYNCIEAMRDLQPEDHVVQHVLDELNHIVFAYNTISEYEATMMDDEFIDRGY